MSLCSTFTSGSPSPIELKPKCLQWPVRLYKSWVHPPNTAPRNLLDQIFYCSQSCSCCAAATLAFWLLLEPSPSDIQANPAVPWSLWAFASIAFSDHHALLFSSCTYFYSVTLLSTDTSCFYLFVYCLAPSTTSRTSPGLGLCHSHCWCKSWIELNLAHGRLSADSL